MPERQGTSMMVLLKRGLLPVASAALLSLSQVSADCVRTGTALTSQNSACYSFTKGNPLRESVGQYAGADDATLKGFLAQMPQPSAECCAVARPFISDSCGCNYNFVRLANNFGFPSARVVAGYQLLKVSSCNSDVYGGYIQDSCSLDELKGAAAIGGPIPQPPQAPAAAVYSVQQQGGTTIREVQPAPQASKDASTLTSASSLQSTAADTSPATGNPLVDAVTTVMHAVEQAITPRTPTLAAAQAPPSPWMAIDGPQGDSSSSGILGTYVAPPAHAPVAAVVEAAVAPATQPMAATLPGLSPAQAPQEAILAPTAQPMAAVLPGLSPAEAPQEAALAPAGQSMAAVLPDQSPPAYPIFQSAGPQQVNPQVAELESAASPSPWTGWLRVPRRA